MTSTTSTYRPRRGAALAAAALVAATLTLGACSAGGDSGSSDSADIAGSADGAADGGSNVGADAGSGDAADGSALGSVAQAADDRAPAAAPSTQQVVQVGEVSMTVDDVRVAADAVVDLAETAGGRVDDRTEHDATEDTRGSASLKIRVPSEQMTATLAALRKLGTVEQVDVHSQDVTNAAKDLDARIHGLQLSVARMEDLLAGATTNETIVSAESSLTERQTSLEQLQSQRALLADQVRLSTLTVAIAGPEVVVVVPPEPVSGPQSFLEGLAAGWDAFSAMVRVATIVLGVLLPWLAFGGAIAAGVVAVTRWRRARSGAPVAPVAPVAPRAAGAVPVPAVVPSPDEEARP